MGALTYQPLAAMGAAFLFVLLAVPMLRPVAHRVKLVDKPCSRKRHEGLVPLIGGVAMFAAFCIALWIVPATLRPFASLVVGMGLLLGVGLVDDLLDIPAGTKLFAQIVVAVLMVSWGEVQIHTLGNLVGVKPIELGEWAIPFTVLCTLVFINALNMADGTDGLAGGLAAVALGMLLAIGILGEADRAFLSVVGVLFAAVVGFLCFNLRVPGRRQATVFMGDSGSMMLGYALAWLAVYISQAGRVEVYPITIAWILVLPVLDLVTLYVRRLRKGQSPFQADRDHLHHVLIRAGLSVTATVWLLILVMVVFGLVGVFGWYRGWPEYWLFLGLLPLFAAQYFCSVRAWRIMRRLKGDAGV